MSLKQDIEAQEAKHGQKMIEVKIRFWTNDIAEGKNKIIPKNAWSSGVVRIGPNKAHGITAGRPKPFDSLMDVSSIIEKVLIENNIILHHSKKMKKYFSEE